MMQLIKPDWSMSARIHAFSTTRSGGISESPYDALNLGLHVGDDASHVHDNRQRMISAAKSPAAPHWLQQEHGNRIALLNMFDDVNTSEDALLFDAPYKADGSWTDTPDVVLAVLTADCLPLVIAANDGSSVAVVHAGWRGLADGVIVSALSCFPERLPLSVWLGPAIGPDAFEVGDEVRQIFIQRHAENENAFRSGTAEGKWLADIYLLARLEVARHQNAAGCDIAISGGNYCTVTDAELFHSHRRDGARSGRMATVAWIAG